MHGSTHVKLTVALAKMSTEMRLHSLSNVSLRYRNFKTSPTTSRVNWIFFGPINVFDIVNKLISFAKQGYHKKISSRNLFQAITGGLYYNAFCQIVQW